MVFSAPNQCYDITIHCSFAEMCLLFELVSQVSDVANGPLVYSQNLTTEQIHDGL